MAIFPQFWGFSTGFSTVLGSFGEVASPLPGSRYPCYNVLVRTTTPRATMDDALRNIFALKIQERAAKEAFWGVATAQRPGSLMTPEQSRLYEAMQAATRARQIAMAEFGRSMVPDNVV